MRNINEKSCRCPFCFITSLLLFDSCCGLIEIGRLGVAPVKETEKIAEKEPVKETVAKEEKPVVIPEPIIEEKSETGKEEKPKNESSEVEEQKPVEQPKSEEKPVEQPKVEEQKPESKKPANVKIKLSIILYILRNLFM